MAADNKSTLTNAIEYQNVTFNYRNSNNQRAIKIWLANL
jgi:hypothetical protein